MRCKKGSREEERRERKGRKGRWQEVVMEGVNGVGEGGE